MFSVAQFANECEAARASEHGRNAIRGILGAALADPAAIIATLGEPTRAGDWVLYRSARLTILHIVWPPSFTQTPHNHLLWAEIGVYRGREDNILWRRTAPGSKWPIEAVGAVSLCAGQCHSLDPDAIHSVTNPLDRVTAGLHVYGGELLQGPPRSAWDGESLLEKPLDYTRDDRAVAAYNSTLTE